MQMDDPVFTFDLRPSVAEYHGTLVPSFITVRNMQSTSAAMDDEPAPSSTTSAVRLTPSSRNSRTFTSPRASSPPSPPSSPPMLPLLLARRQNSPPSLAQNAKHDT